MTLLAGALHDLSIDPAIGWLAAGGCALLLLAASGHKWRDLSSFRAVLIAYDVLPIEAAALLAVCIPTLELVIGAGLLYPPMCSPAALAASLLLLLYGAAIALNLLRGRSALSCGCGGPGGRWPISRGMVARNVALAAGCLVAALPRVPRPWMAVDALTVCGGLIAMALLYLALGTLWENAPEPGRSGGALS